MSDPSEPSASPLTDHTTAQAVVSREDHGKTVAAVVRSMVPGLPWSRAKALCTRGRVRVGDQPARDPAARVQAGDSISVVSAGEVARARDPEIELLHVDPDVVVVNKPAGLLSVPFDSGDRDTLMHRTHAALRRAEGGRHLPPLRVVQRLDKDTSGVLIFARNKRAERGLGDQLRRHDMHRVYLGLAYGLVPAATYDTWLVRDRGDRRRGSWNARRGKRPANARRAITHVKPREQWTASADRPAITLVECRLETGRQHQIRIHLGEDRHPLVGERVYDRDYLGPRWEAIAATHNRPMLHAAELGVMHPTRDHPLRFTADLPSDFADLLRLLRG